MGFQKIVLMHNDEQGDHDRDPAGWWDRCKQAFSTMWGRKQPTFFIGGQAIWEDHADNTVVIIAGGNHATVFGCFPNGGLHHTEEHQIAILKAILRSKGYRISKCSQTKNSKTE